MDNLKKKYLNFKIDTISISASLLRTIDDDEMFRNSINIMLCNHINDIINIT